MKAFLLHLVAHMYCLMLMDISSVGGIFLFTKENINKPDSEHM